MPQAARPAILTQHMLDAILEGNFPIALPGGGAVNRNRRHHKLRAIQRRIQVSRSLKTEVALGLAIEDTPNLEHEVKARAIDIAENNGAARQFIAIGGKVKQHAQPKTGAACAD